MRLGIWLIRSCDCHMMLYDSIACRFSDTGGDEGEKRKPREREGETDSSQTTNQ